MSRSISIAAALVLLFGCAGDQPDTGTPRAVAGVTDLIGQRVILSYGMPISSEGTPGHLPKADDTTRCSVVGAGGDLREGGLRIDPATKTISLVLPETSEQKQTQPDVHINDSVVS